VPRFCQLFLLARQSGQKTPADWAEFAWNLLKIQGQRLMKEGTALETEEENLAELVRQAQNFQNTQLQVLKALQVV